MAERPSPYAEFCRPKLGELLASLKLDKEYVRAQGTYLYDRDGAAVLDMVGGFGTAFLGHSHPVLVERLVADLRAGVPTNAQVSSREESGRLGQRLSELTGVAAGYYANFSNSGAEANEAAIKHAYKVQFDKVRREYESITRILHDFYTEADRLGGNLILPGDRRKTLIDFRNDIDEYNLAQFELYQNAPVMVALKGSYHGKTTSSLKVTFNKSYREGFEGLSSVRTEYLNLAHPERFAEVVGEHVSCFLFPTLEDGNRVELHELRLTRIFALILEVVLGEGGMRPVPDATLATLATLSRAHDVPLIVDEVQTGCGRLGTVFGYHGTALATVDPEYITLSKALGGGLVKVGATLVRKDLYDPDFGILHTSTFGEDELSSRVALNVLEVLTANGGAVMAEGLRKSERLLSSLQALQEEFPAIVKDVRGRGLMLGLEMRPLQDRSPFFRATGRQGILSLLIASYLLHHHRIRALAPLSSTLKGNPGKERLSILRIQPPVTIADEEVDRLIDALREVFRIVEANDEYSLVAHLLGVEVPAEQRRAPVAVPVRWPVTPHVEHVDARTGFVVHPTKIEHVVDYYFPSSAGRPFPMEALRDWWNAISRFLEPVLVTHTAIRSHGFVLENSLVFVPYLPDRMAGLSDRRTIQEVQDKVQDAVTIAREVGDENIPVCMVGLGAYTSIVTQNGETINDYEVSVTTGNAFTTGLSLLGLLRGAEKLGIAPSEATAAVVGATGNIGLVMAQFLSLSVDRLILLGRSGERATVKLRYVRRQCLDAILRLIGEERAQGVALEESQIAGIGRRVYDLVLEHADTVDDPDGALARALDGRHSGEATTVLLTLLQNPPEGADILDRFVLATDTAALKEADLVAVATSSSDGSLLRPDMLKPHSVVCCASVPSNLSPEFGQHPTILAFDGGLAHLPEDARMDFVGFPGGNLVYGCMAETLVLGFEGSHTSYCKGRVDLDLVRHIVLAAEAHGFRLGNLKLGDRILDDTSES